MLSMGMKKRAFCGFKVIFANSLTYLFAVMTDDVSYNVLPATIYL